MAQVGSVAAKRVVGLMTGETGVSAALAAISLGTDVALPGIGAEQVTAQNVSLELAEKSTAVKYPSLLVYCDSLTNQLREKFRTFSGKAHMVVETRVSQDRLEGLEDELQLYIDAVTQVLDGNRGDWGQGMFYTGGYEVSFGAVKHGGRNFVQVAKVSFEVDVSTN